jgi:hypothetical protein
MAERAANAILIRLAPGVEETEEFLSGAASAFPPQAVRRGADGLLRDYTGRTVDEALSLVRMMTGRDLPPGTKAEHALMRGGYQGAVYYLDTHG